MRIISGEYKGRPIRTTAGPGYRPATGKVRESVFSMLESMGVVWVDTFVADVFAGSGSLAIEALSRGAQGAVFVEKSVKAAALIRTNLESLRVERSRWSIIRDDALKYLGSGQLRAADVVFIDPPYGQDLFLPALKLLLEQRCLAEDGIVCAEIEAALVIENPPFPGLRLLRDKLYGQTRICIWARA